MSDPIPTVTVVIPCRNEAPFIDACVASILAFEDVPGGYEIIAVDGLSDDGTWEKLEAWQLRSGSFRAIRNPGRIVPVGLNLAIREARGGLILRVDAHSEYPPDYLRNAVETSARTGADNVGGVVVTKAASGSLAARLVQYMTTHRFGVGNSRFRLGAAEGPIDTVPFGCYRRDLFPRIGWFDERLVRNQDYEFNRRILRAGGAVWCNPRMAVTYFNRPSPLSLLEQAWTTSHWNVWMWYVAPYSFAARHAIPAAFVLALIVLGVGSAFFKVALVGLLLIAVAYGGLAVVSALRHARTEPIPVRLLLSVWFFLYHASYGLGTLSGALSLLLHRAPVQRLREPWPGAGRFRAWSPNL